MTSPPHLRSPVWAVLLLMVAAAATGASASKIVRRQVVDTSGLSDQDLVACLTAITKGLTCDSLGGESNIDTVNEIPVPVAPEPAACQCVKHWQCDDGTVDPSTGLLPFVNVRSSCFDPLDVCCNNIKKNAVSPPVPPAQQYTPTCGHLNPSGVDATLLGFKENEAQFGQFPWMAAVMTTGLAGSSEANVYVCGASLIHPRVLLTAAHYMTDKVAQELAVRLGEWNFKLPTEPIAHQDIRVERIVIHPQFAANHLRYDVALLFLEEAAVLGPTVDTICLPNPSEKFDGDLCYSSGWGKDVFGATGRYQQILKSIRLPIVEQRQCQQAFRDRTHLGPSFNLHSSFVCAGGVAGIDTCTGDGGSPLVCPLKTNPTRYVQAGVVAWGIGCGQDGVPGVYASVSEAVQWIGQEMLTNMNFDIRAQKP